VHADLDFGTDESDPENYFRRSDNYSFHEYGIPTVSFSTGEHADYHTPDDDADKIDFSKLRTAARLTFELVMELGNRDERICPEK
jgi:Zn-dependent M28 family amino/carboxypeptidase